VTGTNDKDANDFTGAPNADYDSIMRSELGPPSSSFAFDKISISTGKIINVGLNFSVGIRDRPVHVDYDDYISTLLSMAERHFLFYDVAECQAWLVDGVSTVLHLLRTFFRDCKASTKLRTVVMPGFEDLTEAPDDVFGADAAFQVLVQNRDWPIWRASASGQEVRFFCVEHRVRQICNVLQQMTAHVDDVRDGVGKKVKLSPRRQLEGFDFLDVATHQPTIWPKATKIGTFSEGWVDFTRAIHTPTLFGRGFGLMFQPFEKACKTCKWNAVPEKDLLAISVADLKQIIKRHGSPSTNPCRLTQKIFWHTPDRCFESCNCSRASRNKCDWVQLCLPDRFSFPRFRSGRSPPSIYNDDGRYDRGAVLFGHSRKFSLRWGDREIPEEGEPIPEIVEPNTFDSDPPGTEFSASSHDTQASLGDFASSSRNRTPSSISNSSSAKSRPSQDVSANGSDVGGGPASTRRILRRSNRSISERDLQIGRHIL
jgi:hypothetical protein